jgi:predicted histidine transporter YuiF (NhaC family)
MSLKHFIESTFQNLHMKADSLLPQSSYVANGAGFTFGAITFNQWVMGITLVLGIFTFIVNFYYQRQRNKMERARELREAELHRVKMQQAVKRSGN